ncbi:MAG: antitoxin Xre-like helix-turn-helix domain-containing protein [Paraburkholderia tropica]|uniref:antitoxin Xre-like helix-turn-helix domain-containing protein n=1 Tax=Burkholderia TaxID=32008 RepID=UPI00164093B7|nr:MULTISPECIES: antitoxin Xre-like helix-turn-helix domain-containing protein [Burkholderia]WLE64194.1 DUF2384 domain-containing protein [Burkholderia plantarii]
MARHVGKASTTSQSKRARPAAAHVAKASRGAISAALFDVLDFRKVYKSSGVDRIQVIKAGIAATRVFDLAGAMRVSQDVMLKRLGLPKSTVSRKAQAGDMLSIDQGELVLGMSKLIGLVQTIIDESGDPDRIGDFDPATWLEEWLSQPNPALGGVAPSTYLDTREGQEIVSTLLSQMQSGAYA